MSDREEALKFCNAYHHDWVEEYYGYKCSQCLTFIPYGCEPWIDGDCASDELNYELLDSQTRDAEQRDAPAEAGGEWACMCEKPLDDDGWRCIRCGRLLSPRLGG